MFTLAFLDLIFDFVTEVLPDLFEGAVDALSEVPWDTVLGVGVAVATGAALAAGAAMLYDYLDQARLANDLPKIIEQSMEKDEKFRSAISSKIADPNVVSLSSLNALKKRVVNVQTLDDGNKVVDIDVEGCHIKIAAKQLSNDIRPGIRL